MGKAQSGTVAWLGLGVGVLAYDTWALSRDGVTLSRAFKQSVDHRRWRWLVGAAWLVTTGHLFGILPRKYDPYHRYGAFLSRFAPRVG